MSGSFTFSDDMIRSALRSNGWSRLRNDRWYQRDVMARGGNIKEISVDRDSAFKILLRDKNLG